MPGTTVLRVHCRLFVTSAVAAGDGFKWGIIVAPADQAGAYATGAGTHSVNPVDQPYANWLMVNREGAHPGYALCGPNNQFAVDVRAKRKIGNAQSSLFLSVANTGAAASLVYSFYSRVLIALP